MISLTSRSPIDVPPVRNIRFSLSAPIDAPILPTKWQLLIKHPLSYPLPPPAIYLTTLIPITRQLLIPFILAYLFQKQLYLLLLCQCYDHAEHTLRHIIICSTLNFPRGITKLKAHCLLKIATKIFPCIIQLKTLDKFDMLWFNLLFEATIFDVLLKEALKVEVPLVGFGVETFLLLIVSVDRIKEVAATWSETKTKHDSKSTVAGQRGQSQPETLQPL